jgi:ribosomal protein S6--L-glutamate ligase/gamma-F420-2:alpha-L-glutamate ligase
MKAVLIYNHSIADIPYTKKSLDGFVEAAQDLGIQLFLIKNSEVAVLRDKGTVRVKNKVFENEEVQFVVFWDKDLFLADMLAIAGYKVCNSSEAIRLCDDKVLAYQKLITSDVVMPKTIVAPVAYYNEATRNDHYYDVLILELSLPLVIKEAFGSFGRQVHLVSTKEELIEVDSRIGDKKRLYQEFVRESFGKSLRIYCIGGKIAYSLLVTHPSDFRSNTTGAISSLYEADVREIEMAEYVAKEFRLDYCAVDILLTKAGPVFCEINSNAGFSRTGEISDISIPKLYLEHIVETLGLSTNA